MKFLFVCSQNRLRSPTAEAVFSNHPGIEAMSAGTNHDAENPVSLDLIEWADCVLVMEKKHKNKLIKRFKSAFKTKKLVVLDIPDKYEYMEPELISILKAKMDRYIRIKVMRE
ncbi:MAG: phosphotyrosine protein phosphatase [Desulfobacterales bacterium]|nr:phosphotyrosine protein phosphatase [Desulfobacterales bacterium]